MCSRSGGISIGTTFEPIIKVFAKRAFFQRRAQVAIRSGDHAHVHLQRLRSAQALKLALLQHAQQLHLDRRRHVADFIQKQRAFVRQLELAWLAGQCAGKSAALKAEKARFQTACQGWPCC